MKTDVVIIGSGLGGLACAQLLSKRGLGVLVLERQQQPGGCMQSYQRGPFRFDTGLHYVGGLAEGQSLHAAFSELGLLRLPWQRLDADGFDRVTIAGETFPFAEGFTTFAATLAQYFPQEKEALQRYVGMLEHLDDEQSIHVNAWKYLHELFRDELLINVLSGASMKLELRKDTLPLFSFAHLNSAFIESSWRLRGDGNLLVEALTDDIRRQGGEIICNAEVTELVEHDGRITSVHCANGMTYEGDTFICDIHPAVMLSLIKEENSKIKRTFRRRISLQENTFGMFTASLLLKPNTIPYFNHNKYIYRKPNVWTFYEVTTEPVGGVMVSARVPKDGSPFVRQLDLLTPMPWSLCQPFADSTVGHRSAAYRKLKHRFATECIALAESVVPGLSDSISECYTSTPLTYRDYNHSPQGSAYGIRKDCTNALLTVLSPQTPISNLLLTGQNLALHGLQGVVMTAKETCKNIIT